jgi:hypothetical protein
MSMKKKLKVFGKDGVEAVKKEMLQLHERKVMEPRHVTKLTQAQKREALAYLIRDGTIPEIHFFIYLAAFFVAFQIFIHTRHIFLCVHKSHFYAASHLLKVASHTHKMQLFPPFVVTALSPFIFAFSLVVPVEL